MHTAAIDTTKELIEIWVMYTELHGRHYHQMHKPQIPRICQRKEYNCIEGEKIHLMHFCHCQHSRIRHVIEKYTLTRR